MSHPFNGAFTVNAQLKFFSVTVTRQVRFTFGYTPDWPFLDLATGNEKTEPKALSLNLEVFARPGPGAKRPLKAAYWTSANELLAPGVLNHRVHEVLHRMIDEDAQAEDWLRRNGSMPVLQNTL